MHDDSLINSCNNELSIGLLYIYILLFPEHNFIGFETSDSIGMPLLYFIIILFYLLKSLKWPFFIF